MLDKLLNLFNRKNNCNCGNSKKKILIVDDNELDRKLVGRIVEKEGFSTVYANNGEEGLRAAILNQPDLILLDCQMPLMNGTDMCKILKKDDRISRIPVIFITSLDTPRNIIDCFDSDGDSFINKPIKGNVLMEYVWEALNENQAVK